MTLHILYRVATDVQAPEQGAPRKGDFWMRMSMAIIVRGKFAAFIGAVLALTLTGPRLQGQSALTDLTADPIIGAGRTYLTGLHEAVDPATGQLALRFPVALPASRGFGLHFAVAYDSGTRVSYEPYDSRTFANSYLYRDGWSYTVPNISYLSLEVPYYGYNSYGDYVQLGTCDDLTNYVYSDDSGGRFDLGMERAWDPAGTPPPNDACTSLNINGNSSPGGWFGGVAWFDPTRLDTDDVIDLSTNDGLGMTMLNPEHYRAGGTNVSPTTVTLIDRLTDRNGNIYRIADNGGGKIVYTDSDGCTALSTSGFADSSDTITAGGRTWTVAWQAGTAQAVSVPTSLNYTPTGHTCPADAGLLTPSTSNGITNIRLPNSTAYTLAYDPVYGQVSKLTYPSGAYVRYVWGFGAYSEYTALGFSDGSSCTYMAAPLVITDRYVSPDGGPETLHQTFTYTASAVAPRSYGPATRTTTVRDYDGSGHVLATHVYTYDDTNGVRPQATTIQTENAQGTVVRTVQQTWPAGAVELPPTAIVTTLDNGKVAKTTRSYDTYGQLLEQDDYDYGPGTPGPLLRKRTYAWLHDGNIPTTGAPTLPWIVDRPALSEVFDGTSSTPASATVDCYDQTSVASVSGLTAHDDANFGVGQTNRGNLTQQLQWLNPTGSNALPTCGQATGSNALSSTYSYDEAGQLLSATDPGGHTTTYTWGDVTGAPSGTDGFLLQVQDPDTASPDLAHHSESYTWDYLTGHLLTHTDQNKQVTRYQYADSLGRLTDIQFPDGGETKISYSDTPGNLYTEIQCKIDGTRWTDAFTYFDGLGRAITSCAVNDEATPWDRVDTQYDGEGRVAFRSYPYQATSCTGTNSEPGDTFSYDALGRPLTVTHSDQSQITTSYWGAATEVADEGNGSFHVTHVYQHDGLGRLVSVCEANGATGAGTSSNPIACSGQISGFAQDINLTGFATGYTYDALGDLVRVQQPGLADRSFSYDSLGRLLSASNPETGTVRYVWDDDALEANHSPGDLLRRQDAAGVNTSYWYDALHRLTTITYDGATPQRQFHYDEASAFGVSLSHTIGRRSSELINHYGTQSAAVFNYDARGRVLDNSQCTPHNCGSGLFPISYTYDLLGDPTQVVNGAGVAINPSWNRAQHLTGVSSSLVDSQHPATLLSNVHYGPFGPVTGTLGGVAESRGYTARGWLDSVQAGSLWSLSLGYQPDGMVASANDSVNGSWTYGDDSLNRLQTANCSSHCPGQAAEAALDLGWSYDRYGNRWAQAVTAGSAPGPSAAFADGNNRMDGWSYDAAGHLLSDGVHQYGYDAEGRLTTVDGGATASYLYDAEGRRVRRSVGARVHDLLYDLQGHAMTEMEFDNSYNGWTRGEIWAGGRHLATYADATTDFDHGDGLGTERLRTRVDGAVYETCVSLPFGDAQNCSFPNGAGTDSPLHFTGQPRDAETGLDDFGFRYNSSTLGRFMTPDDGSDQDAGDPQSWNLYSYVRNNPVSNVDPDGHTCVTTDNGEIADNMDGKGCDQLDDADQVVNVRAGLSTADLVGGSIVDQSAGRWFVGFSNLVLNGKASGLRDMAAGMAVGALAIAGAGEGKAGEEPTTIGPDLRWGDPAKLEQHFLKHGGDFEAKTAGQYAAMAQKFALRTDTQVKVDDKGIVRIWDPETRTFGSYNPDGSTRTFFKAPSPTYFDRQPGQRIR